MAAFQDQKVVDEVEKFIAPMRFSETLFFSGCGVLTLSGPVLFLFFRYYRNEEFVTCVGLTLFMLFFLMIAVAMVGRAFELRQVGIVRASFSRRFSPEKNQAEWNVVVKYLRDQSGGNTSIQELLKQLGGSAQPPAGPPETQLASQLKQLDEPAAPLPTEAPKPPPVSPTTPSSKASPAADSFRPVGKKVIPLEPFTDNPPARKR